MPRIRHRPAVRRHCFGTIYRTFRSTPPHARRAMCPTWCPCLSDADWCLQSDALPDSRLLTWAWFTSSGTRPTPQPSSTRTMPSGSPRATTRMRSPRTRPPTVSPAAPACVSGGGTQQARGIRLHPQPSPQITPKQQQQQQQQQQPAPTNRFP